MTDYTGMTIGRLTVIRKTEFRDRGSIVWECSCKCGLTGLIPASYLHPSKARKGCGNCGDTKHPLYTIWRGIIARCDSPESQSYKYYGGRGIKVCNRWKEDFLTFVSDMGPRPDKHSIERIDVNGHYEPSNCKWADASEQGVNKQGLPRILTDQDICDIYYASRTLPSKAIAAAYGCTFKTVLNIRCKQHGKARMEKILATLTPHPVKLRL